MKKSQISIEHACPPTVFSDIDGTIWKHEWDVRHSMNGTQRLLPDVFNKFLDWHRQGFRIILTTGRPEFLREDTERQLKELGIFYNQLVMDCGPGPRVMINDTPANSPSTKTIAVDLVRDVGMEELRITYSQDI